MDRDYFLSIVFILFFLLSGTAAAQEVIMEISPNPVGRGERFNIDFFIDYPDMTGITVNPPEMPDGIRFYSGPYMRPYWLEMEDGSSRKKTKVTFTYTAGSTGRFGIDPFSVTAGNRVYISEPRMLEAGLYKNRKIYIPYDIRWIIDDADVYEGQAVPLILQVKDLDKVIFFEDIDVPAPERAFLDRADELGDVSERKLGDYTLYTVPAAGYIFTPASSGTVRIPSASITARGITSSSDALSVAVREIPEAIESTGAIGRFRLTWYLEKESISLDENPVLHVRIEGTGNLNYFQIPDPHGDDLTLVNLQETSEYAASSGGYRGFRENIYTFISESAGSKTLIIPAFPYLDVNSGNVRSGSEYTVRVEIIANQVFQETGGEESSFPFAPEPVSGRGLSGGNRYKQPASYLWLLPGPLVFLVFLFTGKKKYLVGISIIFMAASGAHLLVETANSGIEYYSNGNYEDALSAFQKAEEDSPNNAGISYNLALTYFQLDDVGNAVYNARKAFYLDPANSKYKKLVNFIESEKNLKFPLDLSFSLYPDTFFFILMILVNITSFTGVIYLVKSRNIYFISAVLLLSLSVLTGGGLIFSVFQEQKEVAIAMEQSVPVKKIPSEGSESVFSLSEGESARIKGESDGYLFITTGSGLKGWTEQKYLKVLTSP